MTSHFYGFLVVCTAMRGPSETFKTAPGFARTSLMVDWPGAWIKSPVSSSLLGKMEF